MNTFFDIIVLGNAAADAGEPLVDNWPQTRGFLLMFGRAAGGPDKVIVSTFETRFPESFHELSLEEQALIPNSHAYAITRTKVARLLAALGAIDDPWEALRMMIRRAGREDIERCLPGLATPAKEAKVMPFQISSEWVWSLDAEKGILTEEQLERRFRREQRRGKAPQAKLETSVRQRLRQGVTAFDGLFEIPEIAASGLLPSEPIGPPPVYDRQGRVKFELPNRLALYHAAAGHGPRGGLPQVWQAICIAGICKPTDDPTADDLLTLDMWSRIERLSEQETGVKGASWRQYIGRTRRLLLQHAALPLSPSETLPQWLEGMITQKRDRVPLLKLWKLLVDRNRMEVVPDEILNLAIWRELWAKVPPKISPRVWSQYEGRARKLMVRHAKVQMDPYRVVTRAWADLPPDSKVKLGPIRKPAERALLRPLDLSPGWVDQQHLDRTQKLEVHAALQGVFSRAVNCKAPVHTMLALFESD